MHNIAMQCNKKKSRMLCYYYATNTRCHKYETNSKRLWMWYCVDHQIYV